MSFAFLYSSSISDQDCPAVQSNALCYVATKGAVEQISRVLAKDMGSKGITVNTISLGPIDSPLFREGKSQHIIDSIAKQSPSKRLGEPDDVAPIVAFLASQAAQWINGQNIRVDGVCWFSSFRFHSLTLVLGIRRLMKVAIMKHPI